MDTVGEQQPNGRPGTFLKKPINRRNDAPLFEKIFPDNDIGRVLHGLTVMFLSKHEPRMGWPYKGACSEIDSLLDYPNETVSSHMWGVSTLILVVSKLKTFKEEIPNFDISLAMQMANLHDVPELITTDITPQDKVSKEEKAKNEWEAMEQIMGLFPEPVAGSLTKLYHDYESKDSIEAKFVKDCDKLDFMIQAFLLECEGFNCIKDFYVNTLTGPMYTKIAQDLAEQLCKTRNDLNDKGCLYITKRNHDNNNISPP